MSESKLPDTCEIFCFNEKKVERLRTEVTATAGLSELFKAWADDTRMKLLSHHA